MLRGMNRIYGYVNEGDETKKFWRITGPVDEARQQRIERAVLDADQDEEDIREIMFAIEVVDLDKEVYAERMRRCSHAKPIERHMTFKSMGDADRHMGYTYARTSMARSKTRGQAEWSFCGVTFRRFRGD